MIQKKAKKPPTDEDRERFISHLKKIYPLHTKVYIRSRQCAGQVVAQAFFKSDDHIFIGVKTNKGEIIIVSHRDVEHYERASMC
ncbi:hypothetical protein KJ969_03580 [Patescibacteria group bacterium]|nr:hypothetical protein [Patescibacteria group bacterium]MBU1922580.1 hypothetical protein [Patescibacteria group bacterium]